MGASITSPNFIGLATTVKIPIIIFKWDKVYDGK
jgi:hypothetical protein